MNSVIKIDADSVADKILKGVKNDALTPSIPGGGANNAGVLTYKPASKWLEEASRMPVPASLWQSVWFQGELTILFADTNTGKSILAVQIANEISDREAVVYIDCELSSKQFEARYSNNYRNHYPFNANFIRVEINPDSEIEQGMSFEELFMDSMREILENTGAKVLIIDNITYLRNETEKAKDALPLMKELKQLKSRYGLSILALAHTPKRDSSKPLTKNDLQGSKMLINFCDSAFAIGESAQHTSTRYVKQIKARATEIIYDSDNVMVFEIAKPDNYLYFQFVTYSREREHLNTPSESERDLLINKVKELSQQGKSQRDINKELGISLGAVNKYLKI